jgi:hypothetical protein
MCGLGSCVAATDHDDVEMFHVKQPLLSDAETGKDIVQHMLHINPPYK